ncbi:MAG: GNAT family N-acetyltransferase [Pseudomonadota bacterium]
MSDLVISDAVAADRAVITGFMAALQEVERATEPNRRPGAEMAQGHYDHLLDWVSQHPAAADLVAESGGHVAGWLLAGVEIDTGMLVPEAARETGWISDIFVAPSHRGRGIATALIAAAEARFAAHGIRRVEIAAVVGNARAIALYRRLGFAPYELSLGKML